MSSIKTLHKSLTKKMRYYKTTGEFVCRKTGNVLGSTYSNGYRYIYFEGKKYRAHRLAYFYVEGEFPEDHIDHINRNREDNRWRNLRHVPAVVNMRNKSDNKLSDKLVKEIKSRYTPRCSVNGARAMAREFDLHRDTVEKVIKGVLWQI